MALQKQSIPINFSQGLDLKSDPKQVSVGKFLQLQNTVFNKGGLLQKRNGFKRLTDLPNNNSVYATTFKDGLTAIGSSLNAYSESSNQWENKGNIYPVKLDTMSVVRNGSNQVQNDSVVASNGLVCTVYTEQAVSGTDIYKYIIEDSTTGQVVINPTVITVGTGTVTGSPRVFLLGRYFVIMFSVTITATPHIQYFTVSTSNPNIIGAATDFTSTYAPTSFISFDGFVANNFLYVGWKSSGGSVKVSRIDSNLNPYAVTTFATQVADMISVTVDSSNLNVYVSWYDTTANDGYTAVLSSSLAVITAPALTISSEDVLNITSVTQSGVCTFFYEINNAYSYDSAIKTNFIKKNTITSAGVVGSATVLERSVGIASKAFILNDTIYLMSVYSSSFQPTYFLLRSDGNIVSKLAYSNASGYLTRGLPTAYVTDNLVNVTYLIKDLIQSANKEQGVVSPAGVYSQTGINLAMFEFDNEIISSSEIGNNLHMTGGFLWMYDGQVPVEHGFFVYPDSVELTGSTTGGTMTAQEYFYQVVYEWTDNQGNIHRSAPSIPVSVTTTGSTSSVTVNVPTLRLTYKTASPVKIVIYRWSTAQQIYYQVTSITNPLFNNTAVDSVAFVDILPDSSIIGNSIIYTTGGVVENISAPSTRITALYKSRLFLVDSENPDTVWFSKQVIQSTPVEMSDLFTLFVAPTNSAQGNTGPITAIGALDDKLIIFKKNAIYYVLGTGPDNTGANNDFSEPVFITATVGCTNEKSIVFMPNGLMFQSDKGIWLLGRDLQTSYIGAPVEDFNEFSVLSAINVPETNQVRFTLSDGTTLMYDYFYGQWGTFVNVPAVSSTVYTGLHTYINSFGQVFREEQGSYLDGANPVLISFTTGWINVAGLQGFERAYFFYILASYISPHKLTVGLSYDYNNAVTQSTVISPTNYSAPWGSDPLYGDNVLWGGPSSIEQWRVFLEKQKCQAFKIQITESYDSSYGVSPGAGFTMSGLNLLIGVKGVHPKLANAQSVG